ncbi:unnamed protein product [Paramecium octaurelia]|uniref:Uncharacterized protein n=1 Tax=Paramecium octaurelia TaxID=43137 RepID=A0A8S1TRR9_PAROT|nr:unnamed protein product [Paramecium octaurelia]
MTLEKPEKQYYLSPFPKDVIGLIASSFCVQNTREHILWNCSKNITDLSRKNKFIDILREDLLLMN